ncbi:hypothetical protein [Burkholderia phage FLC9]|nr:hypothetical protein [Burkholderia phage FLC9]
MRKTFASTVRVVQVPKMAPAHRSLSLEEEALVLDQAFRDSSAVASGLDEANRLTEVSDALEDLASLAKNIRQASPSEIALIQTSGQMGVAGTTNEPELLLPAMESFQEGGAIAFESIGQKAKMLMKNLLEFLARIWEKIVAFYRMNVVVKDLRGKIKRMQEMMKSGRTGVIHQASSVEEFVSWFNFNGKLLRRTGEMVSAMKQTAETARFIFEDLPKMVQGAGEAVEKSLASFQPETSDQTVQAMVKQLGAIHFESLPHATHEGKDGEYDLYSSAAFIGGGKLQAKIYRPSQGIHPYAALDLIRNSGVTLEKGEDSPSVYAAQMGSFEYPKGPGAMQVLGAADSLLAVIENYHTQHVTALKGVADRLKAAAQKAAAAFDAKTVDESGEEMRDFKAAVNFNTTFARWAQNPAMPFYANIVKTCRFSLMLVQFGLQG